MRAVGTRTSGIWRAAIETAEVVSIVTAMVG
jgi:hypothetical protein